MTNKEITFANYAVFYVKYPCDYGVMETRGGLRLTPITDYSSPACHAPSCPLKPQTTGGYFRIPITSVLLLIKNRDL